VTTIGVDAIGTSTTLESNKSLEHILAGIKRCRIVKDIFRNTKEKYDDLVMEIACGLHNFRVHCRES